MKIIKEIYEEDEAFRDYINEYCENNECTLSEAFKRKTVIEKAEELEGRR